MVWLLKLIRRVRNNLFHGPNDILLVPVKLRLQRTMPASTSRGISQTSDFRLRTSYATTNVRNLILFYLSDVLLYRDRGAFNIRLTFV